ncbi:TetR family transcriptional regulator [Lentzea tibetensis]|uniref:TetR family transcriptional regulator n=1 Tax=Lentzea tibetensis TaxID=2591470 RepID=A0A563F2I9_9PSEU|nr:TetR family transcriptional regulator C-terminal domain-containing protein [Lentzea tibetensis]TWP54175.1 TetR family transcriptional regulator [Lentzea tibetensis]
MAADEVLRARVRQLMALTDGSQRAFAARVGIEPSKLSRSLAGKRRFTPWELARIAETGGVAVDWLLGGDGTPVPPDEAPAGHRDQRRDEILVAAWRLIAERGYHSVRVADIAQACGTSPAAVHYYFPTKQDVLNEALRYCVEQAFTRQRAELGLIDDAHQRLVRLVEMQLPWPGRVRDEWSIWLQFWSEAALRTELRPAHNEFYARWREAVVRIISKGQRQRVFRQDVDPEDAALRFTALTDGAAIQVMTGAPGMTLDRMRGLLLGFIDRELVA